MFYRSVVSSTWAHARLRPVQPSLDSDSGAELTHQTQLHFLLNDIFYSHSGVDENG